jgi:iron(III) transport system permease protein
MPAHNIWGWRSTRTLVLSAAVVAFIVCSVAPIAYLLATTVTTSGELVSTLRLDLRQRGLLYNTALLGAGTAATATLIGTPLGVALARVPLRRKQLLRIALATPAVLPPYVVALAWIYSGGSRGFVAAVTGRDLISEWTYSLPAAIAVLSLVFYPLSMLATEAAMRRIDGRLEEAALMVASPARVLRRITLPLAAPSILAAALVIFVLAISDFGVPALLRVRVYTTEIFTAFAALYDVKRAVLLAMPLLVLSGVISAFAAFVLGDRLIAPRRAAGTRPALVEAWRRPAVGLMLFTIAGALGLPLIVIAREASGAQSFRAIVAGSGEAITNSVVLSAVGATAVILVAAMLAYARARAGQLSGRAADVLFIALFAVPSTIVGVGLIGVWNRPGPAGALYGTAAMFVLAYLARFVPVAALIVGAALRALPVSHEEAASVAGAGWFRTASRIVLPQIRLAAAAAWVITFVLAFGELGVSVLVAPPGEATLPIRIYTIIANTPSSHVAALALLQAVVIFAPLAGLAAATSLAGTR